MAARLKQLAYKLQAALCQKGVYIKINQYQAYSPSKKRMITKFALQRMAQTKDGKPKSVTVLETYQIADVVKKLAAIYSGDEQ